MRVEIRDRAFDPWAEVSEFRRAHLATGKAGASAVFVGTMRDFNEGDDVTAMVLEHYPGMTEQQLETMTRDAIATHELEETFGSLEILELSDGHDPSESASWVVARR
jgi:molybdopterin synthase catalytic subunit